MESSQSTEVVAQHPPPGRVVVFTVTVLQARNVRSTKGETVPLTSVVRYQFLDNEEVESDPVVNSYMPAFNFSKSFERLVQDDLLDQLVNSPLEIHFLELISVQSVTGASEISKVVLGTASIAFDQFVRGDKRIAGWVPLRLTSPTVGASKVPNDDSQPALEVAITLSTPLVDPSIAKEMNVLTIELDGAYGAPESWRAHADPKAAVFDYYLRMALQPASDLLPSLPAFEEGCLLTDTSEATAPPAEGPTSQPLKVVWNKRTKFILRPPAVLELKRILETAPASALRIEFGRTLKKMFGGSTTALSNGSVPLTSSSSNITTLLAAAAPQEDRNAERWRSIMHIDLSPLAAPGATRVEGCYTLLSAAERDASANNAPTIDGAGGAGTIAASISNFDVLSSTSEEREDTQTAKKKQPKRRGSVRPPKEVPQAATAANEMEAIATATSPRASKTASPRAASPAAAANPQVIKRRGTLSNVARPGTSSSSKETQQQQQPTAAGATAAPTTSTGNASGAAGMKGGVAPRARVQKKRRMADVIEKIVAEEEAAEAARPLPFGYNGQFCLKIALSLLVPLVAKPATPKPQLRPSDFIPQRPKLPPHYKTAEASDEFRRDVKRIVEDLAKDYAKIFGLEGDSMPKHERERKFLAELNHGGHYFAYKERLKRAVVRIVKERFSITAFTSNRDKEVFLNQLYVFLVEQMHAALQASIAAKNRRPQTQPLTDEQPTDALKRHAEEAEQVFNRTMADRYHRERIALDKFDENAWADYALFCIRARDHFKALEALKEALSLNNHHAPSLYAYGAMLACQGDYEKSEVFLRGAATETEASESPELLCQAMYAHATLAIVYDELRDKTRSHHSLEQAKTLLQSAAPQARESVHMMLANHLLTLHLPTLAEKAISSEIIACGGSHIGVFFALARLCYQTEEYGQAESHARKALSVDPYHIDSLKLLGHILYMMKRMPEAEKAYENALALIDGSGDSAEAEVDRTMLFRLAELYMSHGKYEQAKLLFLRAARQSVSHVGTASSSHAWLGVGIACLRLGELDAAEEALSEANVQNHLDPEVWGYLALVALKAGRPDEADKALYEALRLELANVPLLQELAEIYLHHGNSAVAEACLRQCAATSVSAQ